METKDLFSDKAKCCGCGMCENACPAQIIRMKEDEYGFLYPHIEESSACLNCKKCLSVCPMKNTDKTESEFIDYYAGSFKNDSDTISCSSGGFATALSRCFVKNGGVVYGVTYTDNLTGIVYARADQIEKLEKFKTSKYAQANKQYVYRDIKEDLKNNTKVLFIGLPCDVAAAKKLFGNNEYFYCCELICHGPTSQLVHRQFIEHLEKRYQSGIKTLTVRHKKDGKWTPFYIKATFNNGKTHYEQFHASAYGAAFRYLKRPSCYSCPIKGSALQGDIMIGDYHYVEPGMKMYNPHGVSSILLHNQKGKELVAMVDESFYINRINKAGAVSNSAINRPVVPPAKQDVFARVFREKGLMKAFSLGFVTLSNVKRKYKTPVLKFAVKIKRVLVPKSRPTE